MYLDGVHFSIRHEKKADATIILTTLGVDLEGNKKVIALYAHAEEKAESLTGCAHPRATQSDLIVTDGHDGLLVVVAELFAAIL